MFIVESRGPSYHQPHYFSYYVLCRPLCLLSYTIESSPYQVHVISNACCHGGHYLNACNATAHKMVQILQEITQFFLKTFNWRGMNGRGSIFPVFIDWDIGNAEYHHHLGNGSFLRFHYSLICEEVVAHEYAHAVLRSLNPTLRYSGETGALDESNADIMAIVFKHWRKGKETIKDWRIVNRNLSTHIGQCCMKEIEQKMSPAERANDYGLVHAKSQIPSHAFYYMVQKMNGRWKEVSLLWVHAIVQASPNETFVGFARKTIKLAPENMQPILSSAWEHVGVNVTLKMGNKERSPTVTIIPVTVQNRPTYASHKKRWAIKGTVS